MADLSYEVNIKGVEDLNALATGVEKVTGVLTAAKGSGKALEELRKVLVGIKGSGSVLHELRDAINQLNSASDRLGNGITRGIKSMEKALTSELKTLQTQVNMLGAEMAKGYTKNFETGIKSGTAGIVSEVKAQGKTIAAVARAQATAAYQNMVGGNAQAKLTQKGLAALFDMQQAGAQISNYHKNLLKVWKAEQDSALALIEANQRSAAARMNAAMGRTLQNSFPTLNKDYVVKSAKDSASVFAEAFANESARTRQRIGNMFPTLDKAYVVKSAKDSASVFSEAFAIEAAATSQRVKNAFPTLDKAYLVKSAKDSAAVFAQAFAAEESRIRSQLSAATNNAVGNYTRYNPNTGLAGGLVKIKDVENTNALGKAMRSLTKDMGYAHSAARGLASGFNLLWLTWGQLIPLFTGAAISFGVTSIVKMGAEVNNTLAVIKNLSQETDAAVQGLNNQLMELSRSGPFGPREVAEAMKTLSLAGLNAEEVANSIKDVLNFSVAGDTSIEKAADVMTSVATAFSVSAKGYAYVGDVIAKTAAVSKASVESIGEAFKTASVLGKQYGVSLEDVGTGIAALANLGIQGSAAGTSLRNMYVDLSGRTPKVRKALNDLNLELRNQDGRFKDIVTLTKEFGTELDKLGTGTDRANAKMAILSERGGKAIVELLDLSKARAKEFGGSWSNALEEMRASIENSAGFVAKASAAMALTPLNQMKSVSASLQTTLVEAFNGLEPVILSVSMRLKEAFNSAEFKSALDTLIIGAANLAKWVTENLSLITKLAVAYAAFSAAKFGASVFLSMASSAETAAKALRGLAAAQTAANGATTLGTTVGAAAGTMATFATQASRVLAILGPLGAAIGLGVTAWQLYDLWSGNAAKTQKDLSSNDYGKAYREQIKAETERIRENTQAILANISAEELRAKKEQTAARARMQQSFDSKRQEAQEAIDKASKRLADYDARGAGTEFAKTAQYEKTRIELIRQETSAREKLLSINRAQLRETELTTAAEAELEKASKAQHAAIKKVAEERAKLLNAPTPGGPSFSPPGVPGSNRRDRGDTETAKAQATLDKLREENRLLKDTGSTVKELTATENAHIDVINKLKKAKDSKTIADLTNAKAILALAVEQDKANEALKRSLEMDKAAFSESAKRVSAIYEEIEALRNRTSILNAQNNLPLAAGNVDLSEGTENQKLLDRAANLELVAQGETNLWNKTQLAIEAEGLRAQVMERQANAAELLNQANRATALAMDEQQFMLQGTIALIGMESEARENALIDLKYEYDLRRQLAAIDARAKSGAISNEVARQETTQAIITNANQKALEKANKAAKSLADYLDPKNMKKFGNEAGNAFKKLVTPLQNVAEAMKDYSKRMEEVSQMRAQAGEDPVKQAKAEDMALQAQLGTVGNLAGAMAGFFDEGSKGYKTLQAVSQAFFLGQQVAAVASMATTLATEPPKQAAYATTAAAASMTLPPPFSFAALAATLAVLAGLGIAMSGGGGGGGSYTGIAKGGTGTVMGMEGEQSKSLANSIEILADNSKIELTYTQKMLSEMTKMREGIQGLAGTASQDFFIRGFAGGAFGDSFLDSGIGFLPGQTVADIIEKGVQGFGFNLIFDKGAQAMWKNLDETFTKGVGAILGNVAEVVFSAAEALGLNDEMLAERMLSLIPVLGDTSTYQQNGMLGMVGGGLVSFKDMSGKEIQEELEAIFSAVGDQMVAAALPQLKPFQRIGEGMFETLTRLTSGIESANYEMEKLGYTAINYTDIIRKNGDIGAEIVRQTLMGVEAELAMYRYGSAGTTVNGATPLTGVAQILETFTGSQEELLEVYSALMDVRKNLKNVGLDFLALSATMVRGSGGLENLSSGLDTYFTEFFSEEEQLAAKTARLTEEFDRINVTMPTSLAAFRKLVESLDLSTESGQYLFGQLMGLTDAFVDVYQAADDASEAVRSIAEGLKLLTDIEGDFLTPGAVKANAVQRIQSTLLEQTGMNFSFEQILGFSRQQFYDEMKWSLSVGNLEWFNALIAVKDDFLSITDDTVTSLENQKSAWQDMVNSLQDTASTLENVKKGAKELSRELSVSLGGPDTKENDLWAIVRGSGSLEDRLAAAEELKSLIEKTSATELQAQKTALANAQKMLDFGKSLKDYVDKLKVGNLSALTPSDKLAEAATQYANTLTKAQGGDQEALGKLQGAADTYLQLAREYDPGAYGSIFNNVTTQLANLGDSLISGYASEVSYREAAIAAAEANNGLTAAQLAKLSELKTVVDSIQLAATSELAKTYEQLTYANTKLAVVESLLTQANNVWAYLPGMGTDIGSIEQSLLNANLTWNSMPASMVQAFAPVIGVPNRAEEELVALTNMMIEKFVQLETAVREGAILQAQTASDAADRTAQLQREAQEELARQLASRGVTSIV